MDQALKTVVFSSKKSSLGTLLKSPSPRLEWRTQLPWQPLTGRETTLLPSPHQTEERLQGCSDRMLIASMICYWITSHFKTKWIKTIIILLSLTVSEGQEFGWASVGTYVCAQMSGILAGKTGAGCGGVSNSAV